MEGNLRPKYIHRSLVNISRLRPCLSHICSHFALRNISTWCLSYSDVHEHMLNDHYKERLSSKARLKIQKKMIVIPSSLLR